MCDAMCGFVGSLGLMIFLGIFLGLLGWLQYCQFRGWRRRRVLHRHRNEQVRSFPQNRLSARRPRCVQIGRLRETVEILDEPATQNDDAVVRIKHRNGENVKIDYATLRELMRSAEGKCRPARLLA
ncbi:MAG: hypothetical protein OET44_02090 [Gammaproteobacteria bacterium]|nr:hypothetical protein [Gammaproteobacteria bacterium]